MIIFHSPWQASLAMASRAIKFSAELILSRAYVRSCFFERDYAENLIIFKQIFSSVFSSQENLVMLDMFLVF